MLAESEQLSEQAELHYALWEMTGDVAEAAAARALYRQAGNDLSEVVVRRRLMMLPTSNEG